MAREFEISGMHCGGCVNRVTKALRALDAGVVVTLEPPRAVFSAQAQASIDAVNSALAGIGEFRANEVA